MADTEVQEEIQEEIDPSQSSNVTLNESDIVSAVRINLDEIGLNDSDFDGGKDESELDTIIKQKINEAYSFILSKCPVEKLDSSNYEEATTTSQGNASFTGGTISPAKATITGGFRFLWAWGNGWPYLVTDYITWGDKEYATLKNVHTTGTPERPKVGIVPSSTKGSYDVELYVTTTGKVAYIPTNAEYTTGETKMSSDTYPALLYYVTALVLLTLRDSQHAQDMMAQAMSLLGIDTSKAT